MFATHFLPINYIQGTFYLLAFLLDLYCSSKIKYVWFLYQIYADLFVFIDLLELK